MLIEKRNFFKGLDGDTSQRLLEDGFMLNLMNGRVGVTEFGRNGRVENVPGTTQATNNNVPPYGNNLTIGSCVDFARGYVLFFDYNTFSDHAIYCYDILNDVAYGVLYDSQVTDGLNFSKSYRIDRNCKIVGDMLYWTDNLNPPRRINYIAAIKTNHPSFSTSVTAYTNPISQSVISLTRRPYGLAVTASKTTDGGFSENFIKDFSGQAAHRIIYRDGEYSTVGVPCAMLNYNLSTDTYNAIDFTFPLTETFDQDTQIIQLLVRFGNSPEYFVFKEWNKDVAADLAEINAHNAGSTALTYRFYNDSIGVPVGKDDSVKPADSIPVTAKTLEIAINRLFLANYVKGYNTPTTTSLSVNTINTNTSDPSGDSSAFPPDSSYQIAVRFRDNSGRKSFIVTNSNCILNVPDRTFSSTSFVSGFAWALSNALATIEIPDWAYYYDILITKNLSKSFFVSNLSSDIQYAKKNSDGTYTYQATYDPSAYGIAVNIATLVGKGQGYLFNDGDMCKLYLSSTSTIYNLPVLAQDGDYVIIKNNDIGNLSTIPGCIFEIYTPYKKLQNEPFYTTGQSYKVTNPTTGSRSYSTTSGTITGETTRSKVTVNIIFATLTWRYWSMSPSVNHWQDWFGIYGESNIQSLLGQVNKTNFVQWSNVKIIGAQSNGLSTFDALDEKAIPLELGQINKLQLTNKVSDMGQGNVMLAICPTETASLYLGEVQMTAASLKGQVGLSSDVIGSINALTGSLGTNNPESVIPYLGLVFWYDSLNGCFVQYSTNGLEKVSDYKMKRFFQRYSKDYLPASTNNLDNINGFHHIPTGINPFHKEVMCTLPGLIYQNYATNLPSYSSVPSYATSIINRFDIYDQLAKTMCFSFEENKWGGTFEFMPEWYEYFENKAFGFKNGRMWTFDTNTTNWNTFFGTTYPVRLCFTGNFNPSLMKVANNISVEGSDIPNYVVVLTAVPNQQITDLASTDSSWVNNEGVFYAYLLGDRLDPNSSGTADQKLFTGNPLRDFAIFAMCEWQSYTGLMYCQFVNIGYNPSKGQQNITQIVNT